MDVLSDVLKTVRLTGAVFFDVDFTAPWVAEAPPGAVIASNVMPEAEHIIMFHAITSGEGWAELLDNSTPPFRLAAGDIIVLPMSDAHVLCSTPGMRATPDLAMYRRPADRHLPIYIEKGDGGGEQTHFVCGYLGCDARPFNPVLQGLPRLLHARGSDGVGSNTELFRLAINETATRRSGSETVLSKVAELMFVDVVRHYIDTLPAAAASWLSGLRDPHVCAALTLMHGRPAEPWTLERLAREVGVSRSVLADRFTHFVREPPMQYLTRWRMQLATRLLERQGMGLARIAAEVGYDSEAAFNRAFKKCVGVPPGAWRRGHQALAETYTPQ